MHMCAHVSVYGHKHAVVPLWRPIDLKESVLCLHRVDPRDQVQVIRLNYQSPYVLSHTTIFSIVSTHFWLAPEHFFVSR